MSMRYKLSLETLKPCLQPSAPPSLPVSNLLSFASRRAVKTSLQRRWKVLVYVDLACSSTRKTYK